MKYHDLKELVFKENLNPGEFFRDPFYGMIEYKFYNGYAFFAMLDDALLVSIIPAKDDNDALISLRLPLSEITHTEVKKRIFGQYTVDIYFEDGSVCKTRASKKMVGGRLDCQEESMMNFVDFMSRYNK